MNKSRMPSNFPSGSRITSSGPRIPCKEPRRNQVTNEAYPIRNFGMCVTPPRLPPRFPRNDSQRTSSLSDRLEQPLRLQIAFNLIETFKELSGYNTLLKKETGAILAGRRQEESYLVDTIFLPQQDGFSDRFQTKAKLIYSTFSKRILTWCYLVLSTPTQGSTPSCPVWTCTCCSIMQLQIMQLSA